MNDGDRTGEKQELEQASRDFADAMALFQTTGSRLASLLDEKEASHDEAAELCMRMRGISALASEIKGQLSQAVLSWLARNRWGFAEIVIGDDKYYGVKEKSEKLNNLKQAFQYLSARAIGPVVLTAVWGDEQNATAILDAVANLAEKIVSASGLKSGAVRQLCGELAASELAEKELEATPAQIAAEQRRMFEKLYTVIWEDDLEEGEPAKALGVANMRFLMRRAGDEWTKKRLAEMLERAKLAREQALARQRDASWEAISKEVIDEDSGQ